MQALPFLRHRLRLAWAVPGLLLLALGCDRATQESKIERFTVKTAPMDITVVESGNLEAIESMSIVSQVSRSVKIVEIVEEGTVITDEDVKAEKVLVKLDSREFDDQLYSRESDVESDKALLTEAQEALLIQKSDNESSIREAQLQVTYAMNDLRKLVGEKLAEKVLDREPEDISALLDSPDLGGQTKQDLDKLQGDIEIARTKVGRSERKLEYTQKLFDKQYVSKNEMDTDELDLRSEQLSLQTTESKREIFRRYDFVKDFQKAWATLRSAKEKLVREEAVARSRLAQSEAKLRNREASSRRSEVHLQELKDDIAKCTIQATKPGFVVYETPPRWQNTGPIQAGSEIRSRQAIIQLPDLSHMGVKVQIQEAQIDLIAPGQTVSITIDAMPDRHFTGKVTKKAVLPSAQNWWANPDLKVYETSIAFDGENPGSILRPGMTATVEILIERLDNVVSIPIQSVQTDEQGKHYCYRASGERAEVELGKRNQVFVQITAGLATGDEILMTPPELSVTDTTDSSNE